MIRAGVDKQNMPAKYPALRFVVKANWILGIFIAAIGIMVMLIAFSKAPLGMIGGLLIVLFAVSVIAFGDVFQVLLDIESNTRPRPPALNDTLTHPTNCECARCNRVRELTAK